MSNTAIADHALLSDRHFTALIDRSGSVEWLCFPRFDSPSVFGRLLGADAGHWSISPCGTGQASVGTWTGGSCWRQHSEQQPVSWCRPTYWHSDQQRWASDWHECPTSCTPGHRHLRLGRSEGEPI